MISRAPRSFNVKRAAGILAVALPLAAWPAQAEEDTPGQAAISESRSNRHGVCLWQGP